VAIDWSVSRAIRNSLDNVSLFQVFSIVADSQARHGLLAPDGLVPWLYDLKEQTCRRRLLPSVGGSQFAARLIPSAGQEVPLPEKVDLTTRSRFPICFREHRSA
jgi:hypothetical protein